MFEKLSNGLQQEDLYPDREIIPLNIPNFLIFVILIKNYTDKTLHLHYQL